MADIIAFTGHRPPKLGGYGEPTTAKLIKLATEYLATHRPDWAYVGMALGWDQACAYACYKLKIPFTACIPHEGQEDIWPEASKEWYRRLLKAAAEKVVVSPGAYASWKMQTRNEFMVDHANKLVALWDGSQGGTFNCVQYAQAQGKPIENLWKAFKAMP